MYAKNNILLDKFFKPLALFVALNSPFWVYGFFYNIYRPLFNIDYIILFVVAVFFSRLLIPSLIFLYLLEAIAFQYGLYNFTNLNEFFLSINYIKLLHINGVSSYLIAPYIFLFLLILLAVTVFYNLRLLFVRISFIGLGFVFFLIISLDIINNTSRFSYGSGESYLPYNILSSRVYDAVEIYSNRNSMSKTKLPQADESILQKIDVVDWAKKNDDRSILFIIVESLGSFKSEKINKSILDSLKSDDYIISASNIKFNGGTTSGEIRSLCGLVGSFATINSVAGLECLPSNLAKIGWQTLGIHGFSKHMFNRDIWWPWIGLNNNLFLESDELYGMNKCGSVYNGICDDEILKHAFSKINNKKTFVYALTLNTHLPIPKINVDDSMHFLCDTEKLTTLSCQHTQMIKNLFVEIALQMKKSRKKPLIVIVGDHKPHYINRQDLESYSDKETTGVVLLPLL